MKAVALLLFFYLCFSVCVSVSPSNVDGNEENCTTYNGTLGECIKIQNCPSLFTLSKQDSSVNNNLILILSTCGGEEESKVCCDIDEDSIDFGDGEINSAKNRFLGSSGSNIISCPTPEGQSGTCIRTKLCPPLYNMLKSGPFTPDKRNYFIKAGCGFEGKDPKVCCPDEPKEETPYNVPTEPIISPRLPDTDTCGPVFSDRIVGGVAAEVGEFPWMALLEYKTESDSRFKCGGSLISKRYVLTAAHCITESLVSVRLGEYSINTTKDCSFCSDAVDVAITEKIVHPGYLGHTHDIALLRLDREINYTDFIKPICLPTTPDLFCQRYEATNLTVAGWGITENGTSSDTLLKVKVPVQKVTECSALYGSKMQLRPAVLCAGGVKGQDSCGGDSGGPLMVQHHINIYQVGIVSFGSGTCGLENWPAVYTKVSYYVHWLVRQLKP